MSQTRHNAQMQQEIAELKSQFDEFKAGYRRIEAVNEQLRADNQQLRADNQHLRADNRKKDDEIRGLTEKLSQMESTVEKLSAAHTDEGGALAAQRRILDDTVEQVAHMGVELRHVQHLVQDKGRDELRISTTQDVDCDTLHKDLPALLRCSSSSIVTVSKIPPSNRSTTNRTSAGASTSSAGASTSAPPPPDAGTPAAPSAPDQQPPLHTYVVTFINHRQAHRALEGGLLKRKLVANSPANTKWFVDWWLTREELKEREAVFGALKRDLHLKKVVAVYRGTELWKQVPDATAHNGKKWEQVPPPPRPATRS